MSGVNDLYGVQAETGRYFFKLYRAGWRSRPTVLYELDLLAHLDRKGVPVCLPVARRDGERLTEVPALEGTRQGVLFHHAPGRPPSWPFFENEAESRLLGGALAAIHAAAEGFASPHPRPGYDEALLLDQTLAAARPFLADRKAGWDYLRDLARRLRMQLAALQSRGLTWGSATVTSTAATRSSAMTGG